VVDFATFVITVGAAFLGTLWFLLFCFGDTHANPVRPERDADGFRELDADLPFVPMPPHLRTRDEMVAWMTTELPRLTVDGPESRS
jgi:hypothetical protein